MGFLVSPGVEVKEIDLTDIIPAQSTSIGGYAGHFRWGPIGEVVTVSSEKELARIFGAPSSEDATLERSFLEAAAFLKYSNNLKVVRANAATALNSYSSHGDDSPESAGFTISTVTELESNQTALNTLGAHVVARYAGVLGNSLRVHVVNEENYDSQPASVRGSLQFKPGTSDFALDLTGGTAINDEVSVVVVDNGGLFSGVQGEILEVHEGLSIARNAKNQFGESNYWADFVNTNSSLIFGVKDTSTDPEITSVSTDLGAISWLGDDSPGETYVELAGGADASTYTNATVVTALELLEDSETVEVNLLFAFEDSGGETDAKIKTIADSRKDLVGFISAPLAIKDLTSDSSKKTSITTHFDAISSSSYIVFDSTPAYVYNKYRDAFAFIQLHGHIAGLCAATDDAADTWFSPAGLNRGQLRGVTRLAYNPKKADRDELYQKRINPVVTLPGQGTVLFGDKTALTKPSAFDRINVRRLFITIEKAIATASKFQLFELNDTFTRSTFRNAIEPFLRDVQGRRGITDFRVVCDETNNGSAVVDANRFVADIFIKPTRSINFVTLNFVATRTGISFEELIGR
tara:strand:- start:2229 stop:3962 length:1734 start_codon:yes stop_codon:yes gene_type:complete